MSGRASSEVDDAVVIPVRLGSSAFRLSVPAADADRIRSMFADQVDPDLDRGTAVHDVVVREAAGRYAISIDRALWAPGEIVDLGDQLMYALMRASLDAEPRMLHLHGAYVTDRSLGVLIVGPTQSGKSTLTAQLVEAGFDYLTDERVGLDDELGLHPLPKPISLTTGSLEVLRHLDPHRTGQGSRSERLWHVPASAIRPSSNTTDPGTPRLIVMVEYRPGVAVQVETVHPAEMTRFLLADSADAARLGAVGVVKAARFCATQHCVRMVFGHHTGATRQLRQLLHDTPAPIRPVTPIPGASSGRARVEPADRVPPTARPAPMIAPDVRGAVIDGRCLLAREHTGEIIELDEVSSIWLQLLDGDGTLEDVVDEVARENDMTADEVMPMARRMVAVLAEKGLLR